MSIEYGAESDFRAPVMRIDDKGHGMTAVVYDADTRQSEDFDTKLPKWWRKGHSKPVNDATQQPGDRPVMEYIFHCAVEKGLGAFTMYDTEGEPVKLSSGKNKLEVRKLENEDIAFVASSAWIARLVRDAKLNTGHRFRLERLTDARDENGDRLQKVDGTLEILGTVENPQPYKQLEPAGVNYDTAEDVGF